MPKTKLRKVLGLQPPSEGSEWKDMNSFQTIDNHWYFGLISGHCCPFFMSIIKALWLVSMNAAETAVRTNAISDCGGEDFPFCITGVVTFCLLFLQAPQ